MTRVAAEAAALLAPRGIACEIVDLRTLAPLDMPLVCASVAKTGALLTLEEGQTTCGVGAEIAIRVREALGPVRVGRIGALPAPVSSNPVLEAACLPDGAAVAAAVQRLLAS
jgi:pyruvate/2-oxoglutarate/acetoin dehydrogenase E1 component